LPHFILFGIKTPCTDFCDFIMATHAGFDPNWYMQELIEPARKSVEKTIISIDLPAGVKDINYTWSDLVPTEQTEAALESQQAARIVPGRRGAGEDRLNHASVRRYGHNVSKTNSCGFSAIIRAHDHAGVSGIGNIGKLIDNPSSPWKGLTPFEWYPLSESYDAYTFIAARNIASVGADSRWNAYGILKAGDNGRWYLQPIEFQ